MEHLTTVQPGEGPGAGSVSDEEEEEEAEHEPEADESARGRKKQLRGELGKLSFSMNKGIIHQNATCVWSCCGAAWEKRKCKAAKNDVDVGKSNRCSSMVPVSW